MDIRGSSARRRNPYQYGRGREPRGDPSRVHLSLIHRIKVNDPYLKEMAVGDILKDKRTAALLAKALRGNTNLKRLTFREYGYDMDHFNMVLDALPETRVVKIAVGPQSQMLSYDGTYAMTIGGRIPSLRSMIKLDLNSCHIGPEGAISLAAILTNNDTLKHLDIPENDIRDEGAVAIGHMLKKNRTLKEVVLDSNGITAYGQRALRNAIFDDSSFEAVVNSNHVLQSYFYNPRSVFGKSVMNDILSSHAANLRSKTNEQAATKKLKRVLKRKYRVDLQFESFLSMESALLPLVLGWVSEKCDVNMMYELGPILLNLIEGRG